MSEDRHPGISMHKLPVGGGFVGIVFAVGCAAIFVIGLPSLWYFVVFSAVLGIAITALIRYFQQGRADRDRPFSILVVKEKRSGRARTKARNDGNLSILSRGQLGRSSPRQPSNAFW